MDSIPHNLETIRERIRSAAARAGRDASDIRLVAVSKTHPCEAILEAQAAGQLVFGENKVQEALTKIPRLPPTLEWHFIGHLQSNKIRKALPLFHLFHGVDNSVLATQINRVAEECALSPRILLEVNVSGEASKFGFEPAVLREEIAGLLALPHIQIVGLMTMAPYAENPLEAKPYFAALRQLRDELARETGHPFPELSMGMSGDFEAAIEEGSTLVRVGTAIFGERARPPA